MLPAYLDITSRISIEPLWWDGNGVPRYDPFHPRMLGVYDEVSLLVEIACQLCGKRFTVGVGVSVMQAMMSSTFNGIAGESLLERFAETFHYGDPPRHGGCTGETMNCEDLRVLEAWVEDGVGEWSRRTRLEGAIGDAFEETETPNEGNAGDGVAELGDAGRDAAAHDARDGADSQDVGPATSETFPAAEEGGPAEPCGRSPLGGAS